MFNFNISKRIFDSFEEEVDLLLSVKSLLPRFLNSIPDNEFVCICNFLNKRGKKVVGSNLKTPIFVETGCGASTIAFAYFAMKYGGKSYTWDPNQLKISEIRRAINESLGLNLNINFEKYWKTVQHVSNSKTVGIDILSEFGEKIDLFMHDSEHTHSTLLSELELTIKNSSNNFNVLIDDAHYKFVNYDYAYANTMRRKLNLKDIEPPIESQGDEMYIVAENYFKEKNINYENLRNEINNIFNSNEKTNHLDLHNNLLNATGLKEYSKGTLSSDRFAAFEIQKE